MKMKTRLTTLFVILITSGQLFSATEVERLRKLCAEQEMQIQQLELKIARLSDTPAPVSKKFTPPASSPTVQSEVTPKNEANSQSSPSTYTVVAGDNMAKIARKVGSTSAALNRLNGLKSDSVIHPGQKLKIPTSSATVATVETPSTPATSAVTQKHKIVAGETFYSISRKYGVTVNELIASNPKVNHRALRVGQSIQISKPETTSVESTSQPVSSSSIPISNKPAPPKQPRASDKPVKITNEITYGKFAEAHSTTTSRLDELNGLELDPSTVLAKGSELYIPAY